MRLSARSPDSGEHLFGEVARMADSVSVGRYTYRLRLSSSARRMLLVEWDRCRWVWNQCVAESRETHRYNRENPDDPRTCGPAQLDRLLTGWRAG